MVLLAPLEALFMGYTAFALAALLALADLGVISRHTLRCALLLIVFGGAGTVTVSLGWTLTWFAWHTR